ncbi:MAG: SDR family oxidoreductase [Alphaproteobacteria bacterium]|nr:SDR family oxidoreductase [Alphaproteobacteria bacterium]MBU2085214.1 SDR family oxidoreductase [Alphaproteobacteria bacterium]MBU2142144.1 SDR family oxidoreductase [Alphaproteobacteria bacterium]MBU2197036.1 SDR family oxidoreductase [Alphaproteobacteria bacterium]
MIDYAGRVALVTGAGSGIGRALAEALAGRGAKVVCADIDEAGAKATATGIGHGSLAIACDLADHDAAGALIAEAVHWQGRLDLVCSNAGIGFGKRLIKQQQDAAADRLMEVNLFANLRIAQAYARLMQATGASGRLMITGSENSLSRPDAVQGTGQGLYAVTKHGVLIMTEWMRDEFTSGNVPVELHILMPGAVYTGLIAPLIRDPAKAPAGLNLIMPERCAEIALRGMDLGLFYIPTHAHIAEDMKPRTQGVADALAALGLS